MHAQHRRRRLTLGLAAGVAALALAAPAATAHYRSSNAVATWNENAGKAAVAACISPVGPSPAEAHLYAMAHVAIHDALNAITGAPSRTRTTRARRRRIAGRGGRRGGARRARPGPRPARRPRPAGRASTPPSPASKRTTPRRSARSATDARRTAASPSARPRRRRSSPCGPTTATQELLGPATSAYTQGTARASTASRPGRRSPSPRDWASVTPFVLRDGSQFRPGPPHAVTDQRYTADYNEIKRLGGDGVTTPSARTPDQTEIALFWVRELTAAVEPDRQDGRRAPPGSTRGSRRACSACSTWP